MMKRFALALVLAALAGPAFAEQFDDRIALQIGRLEIQNASLGVQVDRLTAQLAEAQAKIKKLEASAPPKKTAPEEP